MGDATPTARTRRWRQLAVFVAGVSAMSTLVGLVVFGPIGERWVRTTVLEAASASLENATLSVDEVRMEWGPSVSLHGVSLMDAGGNERLSFEQLRVRLRPVASISRGELVLDDVSLDALRIVVASEDEDLLPLQEVFAVAGSSTSASSSPAELPIPLTIARVNAAGVVVLGDAGGDLAEEVQVSLEARFEGRGASAAVSEVALVAEGQGATVTRATLQGGVALKDGQWRVDDVRVDALGVSASLDGRVDATDVALGLDVRADELGTVGDILGLPDLEQGVSGRVDVTGTPEDWVVAGAIESLGEARGRVELSGTGDGADWVLRGDVQDLYAADWLPSIGSDDPVMLDGVLAIEGEGVPSSSATLDIAYSGRAGQRLMGTSLGPTDVRLRYVAGALQLEPSTVDGWLGILEATGDVQLDGGPLDLKVNGQIYPDRLALLGFSGVRGVGELAASVQGAGTDGTAPMTFDGTLFYPVFRWGDEVELRALTVRVEGSMLGERLSGWVTVETGAGVLYGVEVASSRTLRATWSREASGRIAVAGRTGVESVRQGETLTLAKTAVTWDATVSEAGALGVRTKGILEELEIGDFPIGSGEFSASMRGDTLGLGVDVRGPGGVGFGVDAVHDMGSGETRVADLWLAPTARAAWRAKDSRWRLHNGDLEDVSFHLEGALGSLLAEGNWPSEGTWDGRVTLDGFQLDLLTELGVSGESEVSGTLGMDLQFAGTGEQPEVLATLGLGNVWVGTDIRGVDLGGTLTSRGSTTHVDMQAIAGSRLLGHLNGVVPISWRGGAPQLDNRGRVRLKAVVSPSSFDRWARHFPSATRDLPAGEASAVFDVEGTWRNPDVRASGVVEAAVSGWSERARMEWQVERRGEALTMWADLREGLVQRVHIEGQAKTEVERVLASVLGDEPVEVDVGDWDILAKGMQFSIDVVDVPAQSLGRLMDAPGDLDGRVHGALTVTGSPYHPVVGGRLDWLQGRIGDVALGPTSWEVFPTPGGYLIDLSVDFAERSAWNMSGTVPFRFNLKESADRWLDGSFDLTVDGALPLALWSFVDPQMQNIDGEVEMQGVVQGPAQQPVPTLTARCEGGGWSALDYGLRFDDLNLDLEVSESEIRLERLRVVPSALRASPTVEVPGSVRARGALALDRGVPGEVRGKVRFVDAPTVSATPELRLRVEGDLDVGGRWDALELDGDIAVKQGRVTVDAASFLEVGQLGLDPSIVIARGSAPSRPLEQEPDTVSTSSVRADLRLDLARNVELTLVMPFLDDYGALGSLVGQLDMNARLGGALDVVYGSQGLDLTGTVDILDGVVGILRSRFEIKESAIVFSGADYSNPVLDITAQMDTGQDVIKLQVGGTPTIPEIDFKSDTLADENQILMTLLTGRSPADMDATEGEGALQALAGVLFNSLLAGAGSFSIEPDGTVRAGLPITTDVYATTLLQPSPGPNESPFTVVLDWSLSPHVVSSTGLGIPRVWTNLFWELRF